MEKQLQFAEADSLHEQMLKSKESPPVGGWSRWSKRKLRIVNSIILMTLCLALVGFISVKFRDLLNSVAQQEEENMKLLNPLIQEESTGGFNVLIVGDWGRLGGYNQSAVAEQMGRVAEEKGVEFIISVGDNFYNYGLSGVDDPAFTQSFTQIYNAESLQKTWHVDDNDYVEFFFYDSNPFLDHYWNSTKHVYDWRGVEPRENYLNNQKEFLASGLAESNATWKVVLAHHPIRSVGSHGDTLELQTQIYPILKENDVHVYANGHDHCLEHITDSTMHFLTSGGGSKAWRGMNDSADKSGLQFFYDGQGFVSMFFNSSTLAFEFHDALGNTLHSAYLSK